MNWLIGLVVGIGLDLGVIHIFNVQDMGLAILIGVIGGIISLAIAAALEEVFW